MKEHEKILFKNILYMGCVQLTNYLLPLLSLPIIAKYLSMDDFGKVLILYSLTIFGLIINDYGFNISGPKFIIENRNILKNIKIFYSNAIMIKILISFFLFILVVLSFNFLKTYNFSFNEVFIIGLIFLTQSFQSLWVFQGFEKMEKITKINIYNKIIYFLLVLSFIFLYENFISVLIAFLISQFFLSLITVKELSRSSIFFEYKYINKKIMMGLLKENFGYFFSRLSVLTYTIFNSLIVGANDSLKMVAIYGVGEKIYQTAISFLSPVTQAFYPYMIKNKKFNLLGGFLCIGVILLSVGCFLVDLVVYDIVVYFFGKDYLVLREILPYFYFLIIIVFISMNIGYPVLGALDQGEKVNLSSYLGCLFFILLNVVIDYSINNLMKILLATEVLVCSIRFYYIIKTKFSWK